MEIKCNSSVKDDFEAIPLISDNVYIRECVVWLHEHFRFDPLTEYVILTFLHS